MSSDTVSTAQHDTGEHGFRPVNITRNGKIRHILMQQIRLNMLHSAD